LSDEQQQQLKAYNISVVENEIEQLVHDAGYVKHIAFKNGSLQNVEAVFARAAFEQHSKIPETLGCAITEQGFLQIDGFQKTTVAGVYAAGDCTTMMRGVSYAVGMGTVAGAMANKELIDENF